jgi:DNA-binding transcriptional MocR family regulator
MFRKIIIMGFAFVGVIPAFAHTTQLSTGQIATAQAKPVALRLMSDREFGGFLERLDSELHRAQQQLKKMDVKTVSRDIQEKQELGRTYDRCLQSLDNSRDEIQKLEQKQTLKLDLFLLIDLNELARNLDAMDEVLVNPVTVSGTSGSHKSLDYARQVLSMDGALATDVSTFQHHFIAFTGIVDSSLEQTDRDAPQPQSQK